MIGPLQKAVFLTKGHDWKPGKGTQMRMQRIVFHDHIYPRNSIEMSQAVIRQKSRTDNLIQNKSKSQFAREKRAIENLGETQRGTKRRSLIGQYLLIHLCEAMRRATQWWSSSNRIGRSQLRYFASFCITEAPPLELSYSWTTNIKAGK